MIDWQQVKQLEEDVGAEDFGEVVILFMAEVDEAIDTLQQAPPTTDKEMSASLHFLKGSAFSLGFQAFGEYCSEGEKLSSSGQTEEVDLGKVVALYHDSKQLFYAEAANHCSFVPE